LKRNRLILTILGLTLLVCGVANAQATRTWVSGVGDDANPCSRTAPCKTFAGAISKTAASGEIDALDPGGFGAVTITKAITLDGGSGIVASILVSGTNGITINAGASDAVTIRNLSLQGIGTGLSGIKLLNAKALHVEHCSISHFTQSGIDIEPTSNPIQVFVSETTSQDNVNGFYASGTGVLVQATVDSSRFENNTNGVLAADNTRMAILNSVASGNSTAGFIAQPNAGPAVVSIGNSMAGNNGVGVQSGGGTASANVRVSNVSLFLNTTGFAAGTQGVITTFGNNSNSGSGAPTATLPLQ
jgi:Right handed beta helix region